MTVDIFNTENRYELILADPPWKQSKGGKKSVRANSSGRPLDYQVCTLEEIEEHLKAAVSLTGENSILFLWTIDKYLNGLYRMPDTGYVFQRSLYLGGMKR